MKNIIFIVTIMLSVMFVGCSNGARVTGKVKYSDGQPVSLGQVALDNGVSCFVGKIETDGSYSMGLVGGKKIPAGSYTVYLQGMIEIKEVMGGEFGADILSSETIYHVAEKYCSRETSDLKLEVQASGNQTFDFTVERFKK
jgi:hypothetical protein